MRLSFTKLVCMIRWLMFVGGGHRFFRPLTELACCFSAAWSDFPNLGRDFPVSKPWISVFSRHIVSDPRARVTRPAGAGHTTCGRGSLTICRSETGMTQSGMAIPDIKNRESLMKIGKVLMEKSGKPYDNRERPQADTKRPHAAGNVRSFMIVSRRIILHRRRPRLLE